MRKQVLRQCKQDSNAYVTTMIDYYGLPKDFPGQDNVTGSEPLRKVKHLEETFKVDINCSNFIPYLMLYEFEGILYSEPQAFTLWFSQKAASALSKERAQFETPEHINNHVDTAPSKRIQKICPGYQKPLHGTLIALDIGLDKIRKECHHFNNWLQHLEGLEDSMRQVKQAQDLDLE
ncbi:MAG: DUF4276 family protein [Chlamydiae bacterium]|nr:DUF4276 family protein [Chlamydiota bacterium]